MHLVIDEHMQAHAHAGLVDEVTPEDELALERYREICAAAEERAATVAQGQAELEDLERWLDAAKPGR